VPTLAISIFRPHDSVGAAIGAAKVGAAIGAAKVGAAIGTASLSVGAGVRASFVHSEQHSHLTGARQSATNTVKFAKSHISSGMLPVKRLFSNRPVSVSETHGCETQ
jgi:hypothetical protein